MDFPVPLHEARRLALLRELCLLDTPPDPAFDLVTEMASQVFDVPIALVSLVDKGRQWFKSRIGLECSETSRDQAFCAYAILDRDVTVVPDALLDERFRAYASVLQAPFIRFYAGAPLITAEGVCLGTLCVVDTKPRDTFGPEQCLMLRTLANMVMLRMESLRTSGYVDPVMAIPNKARLMGDLELHRAAGTLHQGDMAALAVDLCGATYFNDTVKAFGYRYAEEYLIRAKDRLVTLLPPGTTVYRFGVTHIAFLLDRPDADLSLLMQKIALAFDEPLWVQDIPHSAKTTTGALRLATRLDAADVLRSLVMAADTARQKGRGWSFYDPMPDQDQQRAFKILTGLTSALNADNELSLHYQPKVDLNTGACLGVEALLRWTSPVLGPVSPAEFIPLAEKTAHMGRITHWVLDHALAQAADWQRRGLGISVAINVSAKDMDGPNFVSELITMLVRHAVNPRLIELEFTESALIHSPEQLRSNLEAIRTLGLKVSIDDFGTGYSNLTYLKTLDANALKVDQSFVRNLMEDLSDRVIVPALVNLAHKLKLRVVAEGIETYQAYATLAAWGCDEGQGFWIARPMPAAQVEPWLRERSKQAGAPISAPPARGLNSA
jgi:EAL domain-containing protein (putative c-di-GMP-specific phosphodiesterase class I)/GGDEF domain-containing protein